MWYIAGSLFVLGFVAAGISLWESRKQRRSSGEKETTLSASEGERPVDCCGLHDVCERDRVWAAVGRKIDYYEDEELDAYRGMASDTYPEAVVDEFREVLYTLREEEVADWMRSLQLRGIYLPDSLKDEAYILMYK